jgi:hypothetical protein
MSIPALNFTIGKEKNSRVITDTTLSTWFITKSRVFPEATPESSLNYIVLIFFKFDISLEITLKCVGFIATYVFTQTLFWS